MHDALVPIFGESGAVIAQYVITLVVVLGLMALVILAVRRYGSNRISPAARGRLPRLAIVDALAVDNKRRLVLVRRDNVEHLVLIGGPSDIVVEPSIVRQRVAQRPGQPVVSRPAPAGAQAAPQPPPPPPPAARAPPPPPPPTSARTAASRVPEPDPLGSEDPIPFPPRRNPIRAASERLGAMRRQITTPTMAAQPARPPIRPEPLPSIPPPPLADDEDEPAELLPEVMAARLRPPPVRPIYDEPTVEETESPVAEALDDTEKPVSAFAPPTARIASMDPAPSEMPAETIDKSAAPPAAAGEPPEAGGQGEVSDLEQEMARLLGEISTNRTA